MPALAADSRPRRFGNNIKYLPPPCGGHGHRRNISYSIQKSFSAKQTSAGLPGKCPSPPLKSAAAPGLRPGVMSLLMMGVVTTNFTAVGDSVVSSEVHARKRLNGANAEIRPDSSYRFVGTTPIAYRSVCGVFSRYCLAGKGGLAEPVNPAAGYAGRRRPWLLSRN